MKLVYMLAIEQDGLRSSDEMQWLSAVVGCLENQAHQWMREHYPDVDFYTQRLAPAVSRDYHCQMSDCRQHHRVLANAQADQARGEQILARLEEYINQQWDTWRVERVLKNGRTK